MGEPETTTSYIVDQYLTVTPGEPFPLLRVGRLVKNGKVRDVTAELLQQFKLPHFKPAIKRGSHADDAPASGFIKGLEYRDSVLWAIPEWNDSGRSDLERGAFRYHSPEIMWEGAVEDPATGDMIRGPLIVGDALLHTPHLGEAAALYSTSIQGDEEMTEQTVTMPASLYERFLAMFRTEEPDPPKAQPEPQTPAEPGVDVDKFNAIQAERDDLAAQLAEIERNQAQATRVQHFAAELSGTSLAEDAVLHGVLAGLTDEQSGPIVERIKALAEQVKVSNLTADVGNNGESDTTDPQMAFDAAVRGRAAKDGIAYHVAAKLVADEQPNLYAAAMGG